jgi:hypothetical protein
LRSHINNSSSCLTGISKHSPGYPNIQILTGISKPYKQLELVSHRDIQTLTGISKHSNSKTLALVFSYIVFSCLDIPVKHSLSLFIYYVQNPHEKQFKTSLEVQIYHKLQQIMHSHSLREICPVSVFSCLLINRNTDVLWCSGLDPPRASESNSAEALGTRLGGTKN